MIFMSMENEIKKELKEIDAYCKKCYTKGNNMDNWGTSLCGGCPWHYKEKGLERKLKTRCMFCKSFLNLKEIIEKYTSVRTGAYVCLECLSKHKDMYVVDLK